MGKSWKNPHKALAAQKKGKIFTKLAREISVSAKLGGSDPESNSRLKMAINAARSASCPKDTIDRAIKRGSGQLDGEMNFEELTYEGYAPHNVGVIIECQTDNKNRTVSELRGFFKKRNSSLGESGSVQWMFDRVGAVEASKENVDDPEEIAIEVEADDVEPGDQDNQFIFYTQLDDLDGVSKALQNMGWEVLSAEPYFRPKNPSPISEEQKAEVFEFLEGLEDLDDTKKVFASL